MQIKPKNILSVAALTAALAAAVGAQAAFVPGKVRVDIYRNGDTGLGGVLLNALTNYAGFPGRPDEVQYVDWLEFPADGGSIETPGTAAFGDNYGALLTGVIIPNQTGSYIFYLAADDAAEFWLSTDDSPANLRLLVSEPTWGASRNYAGGLSGTVQRKSAAVTLQANQRYFMRGIFKEGGGGDHFSVAMLPESETPVNPDAVNGIVGTLPIAGARLGYLAPDSRSFIEQPSNATVNAGQSVVLKAWAMDAGQGTEVPTYQWFKNNTAIADAIDPNLTTAFLKPADNGAKYKVTATFPSGAITSQEATITVVTDTVAPQLNKVLSTATFNGVDITFSEPVENAGVQGNYAISGGINVTGIEVISPSRVRLQTSTQPGDTQFTLTVSNVRDYAGNPLTPATSTFRSFQFLTGAAFFERWNEISGDTDSLDTFISDTIPSRPPDVTGVYGEFSTPWNLGDEYGARLTAFFVPPTTGNYVFAMAADDQAYLFLSTDENPANKKRIAAEPTWNDRHDWSATDRRNVDAPENVSDTYDSSEWPSGPFTPIALTAGRRYYMELVYREGGGGDGGGATYFLANEARATDGQATRLTGNVIGIFTDPATLPPTITQKPAGRTFAKGDRIELTVVADGPGPLRYQWYKSKLPIAGATSATYLIASAGPQDVGDYYVDVTNDNGTSTSFPDNDCRLVMSGALVIEAADFNYEGGKHKPEASDWGNYRGDAYRGLGAVHDVDYHVNDTDDGTQAYRSVDGASLLDPNIPVKGPEPERDRGGYSITNTFGIGWSDAGEWMNYTRTFPTNTYMIYAGVAYDGRAADQVNMLLGLVDDPTKTADAQVVTPLGQFLSPATGGWSNYDLVPLRKSDGSIATFDLGGVKTLRLTFNKGDGDIGWFMIYPTTGGTDPGDRPTISVSRAANGSASITFTGTLQSSATPGGGYTDVTGATSPYTPTAADGAVRFYRAKK